MSDIADRLEQQADLLWQNVAGFEQKALQRIGERIKAIGKMSVADAQAINNAAFVKQDMQAITKELARITGMNIAEVEKMYGELVASQHDANKVLYDYRGKMFAPLSENRELQAMVRAFARTSGETMINLSMTKALGLINRRGRFIGLQEYIYEAYGKAAVAVASGTADFNSAVRDTIRELGGSGMRINYGGGVTRRLDTAVRQNVLWGAKQVSVEYNEMIGEELGCDGIEIDWHSNPRPNHEFMQGKQYALGGRKTVKGITYESADRALEALTDYGCLHFKTPIILGVSEPTYSSEELRRLNEQNKRTFDIDGKQMTGYECRQSMRRLETEVRKQRDIKTVAKFSGNNGLVRECNEKIRLYTDKYNQIADVSGIKPQYQRMGIVKKLDNSPKKDIINYRNIVSRGMSNGMRKPPTYRLNDAEIEKIRSDIQAIGADESVFEFNKGRYTGYNDVTDKIRICGDVLPDFNSSHPRDLMSSRAVVAHEYYGHRAYRGTPLPKGSWNDEFRASYMAARNTPNLSDEDKRYLVLDALERAKEKGITIKNNDFIRRVLYGY